MLPQILLQFSKYIMIAIALTLVWSAIDSFNHFATHASSFSSLSSVISSLDSGNQGEKIQGYSPASSLAPLINLMPNPKATITFNNFTINAEVANTFWSLSRGLSGRESLAENEGMLFTYNKPQMTYFWMKGMNFPIDIVWLKKISATQAQVIGIESNLQPLKKFAFVYYYPEEPVDMVLEIQANLSNTIGLTSGQVVDFSL